MPSSSPEGFVSGAGDASAEGVASGVFVLGDLVGAGSSGNASHSSFGDRSRCCASAGQGTMSSASRARIINEGKLRCIG